MERINIIMAADENYVQHLGVALVSALENTRTPDLFSITVLDGGISIVNKILLENALHKYGAILTFKKLEPESFSIQIASGQLNIPSMLRMVLHEMEQAGNIIYLECDVIVTGDLMQLFRIDLKGYLMGAVAEVGNHRMAMLGFPGKPYFNTGMLLINASKWLQSDIFRKLTPAFENGSCSRDAFNACLLDQWIPLENTWNYQRDLVVYNKDWKNPRKDLPRIIHFSNETKPWMYFSRNPYDYLYYKYLELTPWRDYRPEGKTLKMVLSKMVKLTLRKANILEGM